MRIDLRRFDELTDAERAAMEGLRAEIDFGTPRPIDELKLYFLDDDAALGPPASFDVERFENGKWAPAAIRRREPATPAGRRPTSAARRERSRRSPRWR